MTWNYRIMRHVNNDAGTGHADEAQYIIHEVFYGEDGNVEGWTENGVVPVSDTRDTMLWVLAKMIEALYRDVLDAETGKPIEPANALSDKVLSRPKGKR